MSESEALSRAQNWARTLNLEMLHPEGGYYREVYRSTDQIEAPFGGRRDLQTSIYFLLMPGQFSALHRLRADEVWHFYDGGDLYIEVIHPDGRYERLMLGRDCGIPQCVVPANTWFAAVPAKTGDFALVGCTLAPGFEFEDWEMAEAEGLCAEYPQHTKLIRALTH